MRLWVCVSMHVRAHAYAGTPLCMRACACMLVCVCTYDEEVAGGSFNIASRSCADGIDQAGAPPTLSNLLTNFSTRATAMAGTVASRAPHALPL
jgi:hypothetical protein